MKKVFSILMVALLATGFMTSCVKDDTTDNSSNDTPSVVINELADTYWKGSTGNIQSTCNYYYLTLNADYTCSLNIDTIIYGGLNTVSYTGTYYYSNGSGLLQLTDNIFGQSPSANITVNGNTLTLMLNENYITLTKQ